MPVKSCSDLLLIKSDIYSLEHGQLVVSGDRLFGTTPVIKLGDHFKKVWRVFAGYHACCVADRVRCVRCVDRSVPEAIQEDP